MRRRRAVGSTSSRIGSRAAAALWIASGLLCAAAPAGAAHHEMDEAHEHPIQVVSTVVGDKNVYIPSTIAVVAGKPHALSIFNTTDKPHGFSIDAAGIMEVVPDQVEHEVELPALPAGVYRIYCQLHPAHRSATLLVVEGPAAAATARDERGRRDQSK